MKSARFFRSISLAFVLSLAALLLIGISSAPAQKPDDLIHPGDRWLDDRGVEIQAHGGGILRLKNTWYWFGEDRSPSNDPAKRYVACYSSTDLTHWKYRGQALALSDPENLGPRFVVERPKVFYNARTRTYVMYMHFDDAGYKLARVAVATSKKVDGPYTYLKSFRPLNQESRDIGQFIDDDGSAYLIFEARPTHGFYIAKLSDDYLSVDKQMSFVNARLEGGAIVHYQGLYYVMGSHLTGWRANPNVYATAPSLSGPWTEMHDIAPPETNTYDTQSSMLLKVAGSKTTTVIYMGDRWMPGTLWDSRYVWMPVQIGDGKMTLPKPQPWKIDVRTGITTVAPEEKVSSP
jgi:hypothetical protein